MKQFLLGIAMVFMLLIGATGFTNDNAEKSIGIGAKVPKVEIANSASSVTLGEETPQYLLVTFWRSDDARSRMTCNEYEHLVTSEKDVDAKVDFVAINMDESETLFHEIVVIDNMNVNTQYRLDDEAGHILNRAFNLDKGMGTVLIAPDGTVEAFNPSANYLRTLGV